MWRWGARDVAITDFVFRAGILGSLRVTAAVVFPDGETIDQTWSRGLGTPAGCSAEVVNGQGTQEERQ
jgi:hypothetical protein